MPQFQITTQAPLIAFISIFLMLGGVVLILFGLGIIQSGTGADIIFKINSGRQTSLMGLVGIILGGIGIFWSISTSPQPPEPAKTPVTAINTPISELPSDTPTPKPINTPEPTNTPRPTPSPTATAVFVVPPPTPPEPTHPTPTPIISPSSRKIAFVSDRGGNDEIYLMNSDGSGLTNLTNNSSNNYKGPVWSPDGSKIAFGSNRDGNWEIYVMYLDGSRQTNLTNHPGGNFDKISWSPDGSQIAFVSDRDGKKKKVQLDFLVDVFVMNSDGSRQTNLTSELSSSQLPDWSPNGQKIAFSSYQNGEWNWDIFLMNPDGSELQQITNLPGFEGDPDWSPDGQQIVFSSDGNIHVMNADGSGLTRLTSGGSDWWPDWSPDSSKIIFQSERDGNWEIYLINADGSGLTNLTNNPAKDEKPAWSP